MSLEMGIKTETLIYINILYNNKKKSNMNTKNRLVSAVIKRSLLDQTDLMRTYELRLVVLYGRAK